MHTLSIWLKAIRPKTLVASLCPVLVGTTLSLSEGIFDALLFLSTLLTALGIQIVTNLANDYFDCIKGADTIDRKGPLRVTAAGLVSHSAMKRAIILSCALTLLFSSFLIAKGGYPIASLTVVSLVLAILYTAGPFPIAYLGLGDLFVFLFFGPVAVGACYYLQTEQLSSFALLAGVAQGALSSSLLILNNLRDIDEDRKANKKTLPARFGIFFGKAQFVFCILLASFVPLLLKEHPFTLLASLIFFPALPLLFQVLKARTPENFIPLFPKIPKLLLLYTALFCIGWML